MVHFKKRINLPDGLWGQWSTWSTCSTTCGSGTQTRRRHCDNPPKSGNGTYCSIDGSSSRDTRPCNLQNCSIGKLEPVKLPIAEFCLIGAHPF